MSTLKELRTQHQQARLELETVQCRAAIRLFRHAVTPAMFAAQTLAEQDIGDWADPHGYLYDEPGWWIGRAGGNLSRHRDREGGKSYPFFETIEELQAIRGRARWQAETNEIAKGILATLANYVIGTGFVYTVSATDDAFSEAADLAQGIVDEFIEENDWDGDLDRELYKRLHRDGEYFHRLHLKKGGRIVSRLIEPEYVTLPTDPRAASSDLGAIDLDWTLGVASEWGDVQDHVGYHVLWDEGSGEWEAIPAEYLLHERIGVDRTIKRGLSTLYCMGPELDRVDRLLRNVGEGAAVQAAIALICEHVPGATGAGISALIGGKADQTFNITMPSGNVRTRQLHRYDPGTRLDIPSGQKYHPGPMAAPQGQNYIPVGQAVLRQIATPLSMPEYMVSGDASNANYASTLVAESPFTKMALFEQHAEMKRHSRLLWRVLSLRIEEFERYGVRSIRHLKRLVTLGIEAPVIEVRDKLQEEQILDAQAAAGVLSKRTRSDKSGLDWEKEQKNIGEETPPPAARGAGLTPSAGGDAALSGALAAAMESARSPEEALAILRDVERARALLPFAREHKSVNNPQHHKTGAAAKQPGKGRTKKEPSERAKRAMASHKSSTKEKQKVAKANEHDAARQLGGLSFPDNEPLDVHLQVGRTLHGIEMKTMLDNGNDKITMHPESRRRKEAWATEGRRKLHTVVLDDRDTFGNKQQHSGHRIYYAEGVGAFRIGSMRKVKDYAELKGGSSERHGVFRQSCPPSFLKRGPHEEISEED